VSENNDVIHVLRHIGTSQVATPGVVGKRKGVISFSEVYLKHRRFTEWWQGDPVCK